MGESGYDCLQIPGAQSGTMCAQWTDADIKNANRFCGNSGGLAKKKDAAAAADTATVCSKWCFRILELFLSNKSFGIDFIWIAIDQTSPYFNF